MFTLSGTATNRLIHDPPSNPFTDPAALAKLASQPFVPATIYGTYQIYGQFCKPTVKEVGRANTLQVLVPGVTYGHVYWNGFDATPTVGYSYAAFANAKGYATLAIDRLGVGKSDHPDPVAIVQRTFQAELYHDLFKQLRGIGRQRYPMFTNWQKIIWVGHSFGSALGTYIATKYSQDADAFILTGTALVVPSAMTKPPTSPPPSGYVPATEYDPKLYPPDKFPTDYYLATNKTGRQSTFYSRPNIDFDTKQADKDFATEQTVTLGELLTIQYNTSTTFSGPVFVSTGRNDGVVCPPDADCGEGKHSKIAGMKTYFPAVPYRKFEAYTQPNAGHCHQQHFSAPLGFTKAHQFLEGQGF